jgi:hypothetical protein
MRKSETTTIPRRTVVDTNGALKEATAQESESNMGREQVTMELRAFLTHICSVIYRERNSRMNEASRLHWRLLQGIPNGGLLEHLAGEHFGQIEEFEESMEELFCE